jgi:hypothetical protein
MRSHILSSGLHPGVPDDAALRTQFVFAAGFAVTPCANAPARFSISVDRRRSAAESKNDYRNTLFGD